MIGFIIFIILIYFGYRFISNCFKTVQNNSNDIYEINNEGESSSNDDSTIPKNQEAISLKDSNYNDCCLGIGIDYRERFQKYFDEYQDDLNENIDISTLSVYSYYVDYIDIQQGMEEAIKAEEDYQNKYNLYKELSSDFIIDEADDMTY